MEDYLSKNAYFLLRHGEANHNIEGYLSDAVHDKVQPARLTVYGREQIGATAEELLTDDINFIYASPLTRTMETASIISRKLGLEIITDTRLRELEFGELSGKPFEEFTSFYTDKDRSTIAPPGGESLSDVRGRVTEFLDEVHGIYNKKNILIISHGDTLWMLEAVLELVEWEDISHMPYIEPGELRVLKGY